MKKQSRFGKKVAGLLRRLVRDEAGVVTMEYIIIGLLVVAVATGAAVYLGRAYTHGLKEQANIVTSTGTNIQKVADDAATDAGNVQTAGKELAEGVANKRTGDAGKAAEGGEGGTGEGGGEQ